MSPVPLLLQLVLLIMCLWRSTSLSIVRELLQCHRVWQVIQAVWQGLQAALSYQHWSFNSTSPDMNTACGYFHTSLLSLMYRLVPVIIPILLPLVHRIMWWGSCCQTNCLLLLEGKCNRRQPQVIPQSLQQVCVYPQKSQKTTSVQS